MKGQTSNHSTKRKYPANRKTVNTDPEMIYSLRSIPFSQARVEQLIESLYKWVDEDSTAKTISVFYKQHALTRSLYSVLLKRHPKLKEAHDEVMHQLGERLWGRSVDRQADWAPVKYRLYRYSPEFQEDSEYNAAITAKAREGSDNGNSQYIVVDTTGKKMNE